jgi:hypothetical protein
VTNIVRCNLASKRVASRAISGRAMSSLAEDGVLSIIDWENSRRQSPALDMRLFAAQAYLLDVLHGERGLLDAFLTTYKVSAGEICDERVARRTAVMFGGFLVFWLPQMDGSLQCGTVCKASCVRCRGR